MKSFDSDILFESEGDNLERKRNMATALWFCQPFSGRNGVVLWADPAHLQNALFYAPLGPELLQDLWEYPDLSFETGAKCSRILFLISQETGF